ncbi:FecR family protein [Rhizosphaericola mali]|uniref:DUF4974 domain-containing protein n=1 Tax=Rhizosphaericola mali TaxID=2545455 RepID=A0A5P2G4I9_9BACT|nr:FecR family protein [Rhizosphaericola mali]QES88680.1 DUF4974 domain-containing protein [Rhizosphaericola mali]
MITHNKHKITQELLVRYVLGEANDNERNRVKDWSMESVANENELNNLSNIINKVDQFRDTHSINLDKEWDKFLSEKDKASSVDYNFNKKKFFFPIRNIAIWIGFILLSTIGYFIYHNYTNNQYIWLDAGNKVCSIRLEDGSSVVLNKGSRLGYSKNFLKENRNVQLFGEAFFSIKHANLPMFTVVYNDVNIKDIGTAFNVKKENEEVQIIVEEGKVNIESNNTILELSANEVAKVNPIDNVIKKSIVKDKFYQYYRTKKFDCIGTPLIELVNGLREFYSEKIELQNSSLDNIPITVYFEDQPISKILDIICDTLKLEWSRQSDGKIIIYKVK